MSHIESPNFNFLRAHDDTLVLYAARAERYVFDDPNTSIMKMRQFAENLAWHCSAHHGIDTSEMDFWDALSLLRRKRIVTAEIHECFDLLRMWGNEANHQGRGDRNAALRALIAGYKIAVWFHRTFGNRNFESPPFRPPPNPADIEAELRDDLDRLRDEAASYQQQLQEAQGKMQQLEGARITLEAEARRQYERLNEQQQILEVTDARQKSETQQLHERIEELVKQAKTKTPEELNSFIERSRQAAYSMRIKNWTTAAIPLAQIRFADKRRSQCRDHAPMYLAQSSSGGMVNAYCCICRRPHTVKWDDFTAIDIWVNCPKCDVRAAPDRVGSNHGFKCDKCGWQCWLASLLPTEVKKSTP